MSGYCRNRNRATNPAQWCFFRFHVDKPYLSGCFVRDCAVFLFFDGRPSLRDPLVLSLDTTTPIEPCRLELRLIVVGEKKLLRWVLPVFCPRRLELPIEDRRTVLNEERVDRFFYNGRSGYRRGAAVRRLAQSGTVAENRLTQLIVELPTSPLRLLAVAGREIVRRPVFCRTGVVTVDRLPDERCVVPERESVMVDLLPWLTDGDLVLFFGPTQ